MYTSITWDNFRPALLGVLTQNNWYDEGTRKWIVNAAEFLWRHTVFQSGSVLYEQQEGIPMGIHCGPVFANLYMAYYERHWLMEMPSDFFYRRYIDDCFAIDSSDERVRSLPCPGLNIQWADSEHGLSFLDVWFHTHSDKFGVCFRPFEKVLNHHQYLPWASDHPLSVKKGLVKGELSRIRAISYESSYFLAWRETFLSRLHSRGWPLRALKSWARQIQWRNYFPSSGLEARTTGSRLIVVSKYNPVWNEVSSTDIWRAMRTEWGRHHLGTETHLPYPPHILVAKKRTPSLWDLVRSVNRNLLHRELEEITFEELSDAMSYLSDSHMSYEPP